MPSKKYSEAMSVISVNVPKPWLKAMEDLCTELGVSRSELIRNYIKDGLREEYVRLTDPDMSFVAEVQGGRP
jgi:metal-responsive CopG/Arc/MetJ family transcriptional regulator